MNRITLEPGKRGVLLWLESASDSVVWHTAEDTALSSDA